MTVRVYGAGFAALGVLLAVLPFLDWYRLNLPERDLRLSGVEVAGELWVVPLIGAVALATGAAILVAAPASRRRVSRWLGAVTAIGATFAALWAAKAAWFHQATAFPVGVPDGPSVPLSIRPFALLTIAAGSALAAAALLWLRSGVD